MLCICGALPFLVPRSHEKRIVWMLNAGEMRIRPSQNWFSIFEGFFGSKIFWVLFYRSNRINFHPVDAKTLSPLLKAKNYCFNTRVKIDFHKNLLNGVNYDEKFFRENSPHNKIHQWWIKLMLSKHESSIDHAARKISNLIKLSSTTWKVLEDDTRVRPLTFL